MKRVCKFLSRASGIEGEEDTYRVGRVDTRHVQDESLQRVEGEKQDQ